jgi:hypothetical protein
VSQLRQQRGAVSAHRGLNGHHFQPDRSRVWLADPRDGCGDGGAGRKARAPRTRPRATRRTGASRGPLTLRLGVSPSVSGRGSGLRAVWGWVSLGAACLDRPGWLVIAWGRCAPGLRGFRPSRPGRLSSVNRGGLSYVPQLAVTKILRRVFPNNRTASEPACHGRGL